MLAMSPHAVIFVIVVCVLIAFAMRGRILAELLVLGAEFGEELQALVGSFVGAGAGAGASVGAGSFVGAGVGAHGGPLHEPKRDTEHAGPATRWFPATIRSIEYSPTPIPDTYDDAQMIALREAYAHAQIGTRLRAICADDANLRRRLGEFVITCALSFGEPYVLSQLEQFVPHAHTHYDAVRGTIEQGLARVDAVRHAVHVDSTPKQPVVFTYGEWCAQLPKFRWDSMRKVANDIDIALALMKYHAVVDDHALLSLPHSVVESARVAGATVEAFVSPMGAQMLRAPQYEVHRTHFCSLFDSDSVFGSYGSFFGVDTSGKYTVMMPPRIESVAASALEKCLREREGNPQTRFQFYGEATGIAYGVARERAPDQVRTIAVGELPLEMPDGTVVPNDYDMFVLDMSAPASIASKG